MGANVKVTDEELAGPLDGTEPVRIIQGGASVQTTTQDIADLADVHSPVTIPYEAVLEIDLADYIWTPLVFDLELEGDVALDFVNGFDGQVIRGRIKQDAVGSRLLTAGPSIRFSDDVPSLTLSTIAERLDYVAFEWHDGNGTADLLSYNRGFA